MRLRKDFYTLCPDCEARIMLTLAAQLQATRLGTSCLCECGHEWVSISEWIYRDSGLLPEAASPFPSAPLPRPHLPEFQPPAQPSIPVQPAVTQPADVNSAMQSLVPLPHAFPASSVFPATAPHSAAGQ
ncbi:MAG: hypothetical protein VB858_22885 [Planctomycetaceae bacterium]